MQWDPPICPVCEIAAPNGKHFGITCCGACAAFFRRTVSEQKLFQCTKGSIGKHFFSPNYTHATSLSVFRSTDSFNATSM